MTFNEQIFRARAAIGRRPMTWLAGGVSVSLVIGLAIGLLAGSSATSDLEAERDELRTQVSEFEANEEIAEPEEEADAPAPGTKADRLLRQLQPLCNESRDQIWRLAHRAVGALRRDGDIETTHLEQLNAAVNTIVTTGLQRNDCGSLFRTLIAQQLATAPKRPTG